MHDTLTRTSPAPDLIAAFRKAGFLTGLDDVTAAALVRRLRVRCESFPDNHVICRSGDVADRFWIMLSGAIRVIEQAKGAEWNVTVRDDGVVGEVGLLRRRRNADLVTLQAVEALVVDYGCVTALEDDPRLAASFYKDLARIIADKLSQATQQRAALTAKTAAEDKLLRRFVPEYGLSLTRATDTGLRADYSDDQVVLLFSDVVGFSDIAERTGPDGTANLMRQVLDAQADAIAQHGGQIDKFIGDAVMAFWVIPGGDENARRKACSGALLAARTAVQRVRSIASPHNGEPVQIRVGLHVGKAFSGNFGSSTRSAFTLIGHDVNIAARLEQAKTGAVTSGVSSLGPIRVSEALYRCLSPAEQVMVPDRSDIKVKETEASIYSGDCRD